MVALPKHGEVTGSHQSQTLQLFYYYFRGCKNPPSEAVPKMGKYHEYFCKKLELSNFQNQIQALIVE